MQFLFTWDPTGCHGNPIVKVFVANFVKITENSQFQYDIVL